MAHTNIEKALEFATEAHKGQYRRGEPPVPYITHPVAVKDILINAGVNDENVLCAALLHDTIEDCGTGATVATDIKNLFGDRVGTLVAELTDPAGTRAERHAHQHEKIKWVETDTVLIKMADRIHNLRCFQAQVEQVDLNKLKEYVGYTKKLVYEIVLRGEEDNEYENAYQALLQKLKTIVEELSARLISVGE